MLWVTMTMVILLAQLGNGLLNHASGDRVESRTGLVHQEHLGSDGQSPGDAQALLLTT